MKYRILHWYHCGSQPVFEAYQDPLFDSGEWFVDVDDIHEFCKKHGQIQLQPPNSSRNITDMWRIIVTDKSGGWEQK